MRLAHLILFVIQLIAPQAVEAGWISENYIDSMTDRSTLKATVKNDSGHTLSLARREDGAVWATFRLADSPPDVFTSQRYPILRVDKYQPHDLDDDRQLEKLARTLPRRAITEPKWIHFWLWSGKSSDGRSELLRQLMNGQVLRIRYFPVGGGFKETDFRLDGANQVISKALDLDGEISSGSLKRNEDLKDATREAYKRCQANAVKEDFSICFARSKECLSAGGTGDSCK